MSWLWPPLVYGQRRGENAPRGAAQKGNPAGPNAQPRTPPAGNAAAENERPNTKPPAGEEAPPEEPAPPEPENTDPLPKLEDLAFPTAERLIKGPAIDWLVLKKDHKVLEIGPVDPRPGTLAMIDERMKRGIPKGIKREQQLREALPYLNVTLLNTENPEYRIHRKFVEEILYYEDMILKRADEMLDKQHLRVAFDLINKLEQVTPSWPGLADRQQRLIYVDAQLRLTANQFESALYLLQELHTVNPKYPGLNARLGEVIDALESQALAAGNYRQARHYLERLRLLENNHPGLGKWAAELTGRAGQKMNASLALLRSGQGDKAVDEIETAARIWPLSEDLNSAYRRVFENYQRLRVGVVDLPPAPEPVPYITPAERRRDALTQVRLFNPSRVDDRIVRYESRMFTEWEPTNLGHSILFRMQQHRATWESQPAIAAGTIAETIARRLKPGTATYDARMSSAVDYLSVSSPFEFRVFFRQAPLRPEALFSVPLQMESGPGTTAPNGNLSWPFYVHSSTPQGIVYRRSRAEPAQVSDRHVAEIIETKYPDYASSVQALLRGEVSLLPRVEPQDVAPLVQHNQRSDFSIYSVALPDTHILQFHPRSQQLQSRALRRALVYSLNRQIILESVLLKEPEGKFGRLISGPFPTNSYAYNPLVKPHRYDPLLAYSLILGAKKELKEFTTLKMICPDDPAIRVAAGHIVEQWNTLFRKPLGLEVTLLPSPPPGTIAGQVRLPAARGSGSETKPAPPDWDIRYEVLRMAEPLIELWPVLTLNTDTEIATVQHIPTWLRQELLLLEQAGDMSSAGEILHRLHKHCWAEVHLIPLWELNPQMVFRKNIRQAPQQPVELYQGIENWRIEAWYPRDVFEPGLSQQLRK